MDHQGSAAIGISVLKMIDDAPTHAEDTGVRLAIADTEDVRTAVELTEIKIAN
jgi:hypothetical protein